MRSTVSRCFRAFLFSAYFLGLTFGFNLLQVLSFLYYPFSKRKVLDFNAYLASFVWKRMQLVFEHSHKAKLTIVGDDIPECESAIVISNHLSFTDMFFIHGLAMRKKILQGCKYFAKDSLKWMPVFGWGIYLNAFIMVKRNWSEDKSRINKVFSKIKSMNSPTWVVSYCEGTRQTPEKLSASQAFAKSRSLPIFKHVMVPRTKGFITTVNSFRESRVEALYDLTLVYYHIPTRQIQMAPSIVRAFMDDLDGEYRFTLNVKRYLIKDLPHDDKGLSDWLIERFREKDLFISEVKEMEDKKQ